MTRAADQPEGARAESTRASALFNGDWSEDDRFRIEEVVNQIEGVHTVRPMAALLGRSWICNSQLVRGHRFYMAHWSRRPGTVVTARSVEDLAAKMLQLSAEPPGEDLF
jgi:hypothetical protein